jgi:hypothetical protein
LANSYRLLHVPSCQLANSYRLLHVPSCQLANSYRDFEEAHCLYLQGRTEISVNFCPSVQRDVPEDLYLHQDRCDSLRVFILQLLFWNAPNTTTFCRLTILPFEYSKMAAIRQPSHVTVWLAYVYCLLWCKRVG